MNSKLAIGGAFGLGALVAWAFTADHFDGKMKRNQLILGDMLARKEAMVADLENRLIDRVPWNPPTDEAVQAASEKVSSGLPDDGLRTTVDTDGSVELISIAEQPDTAVETGEEDTTDYRPRLRHLIEEYTNNPDDRDVFVEQAAKTIEHANETPPFHISRELYASDPEEGDGYSKITLTYYERSRVLVDDDEELIDVNEYVGWNNLRRFGEESGDMDTVFVRNRRLLTDFEVERIVDEDPPVHIRYGLSRDEFVTQKAAGFIKFRDEDSD